MKSRWSGFQSSLANGIKRFLAHKRAIGRKYDGEENCLRLLDRFLVQEGVENTAEITADVLDAFLASRSWRRPRGFNQLLGVLALLFRWLVAQGELQCSPLRAHLRREVPQRIPFLFDASQARCLLDLAGSMPEDGRALLRGPVYRTIFAILYGLGLRAGEVSRLCCGDLDLDRELLVIRQTKFTKSRLVPFGPRMAALLRHYLQLRTERWGEPAPDAPLFTFGRGRPVAPGTISMTFHNLVAKLGLNVPPGTSSPRLHDLRHAFAVGTLLRWYRAGIQPATRLFQLSTFLGHVDPKSTAVYLTITSDLLQEANRRFEKFVTSIFQEVSS